MWIFYFHKVLKGCSRDSVWLRVGTPSGRGFEGFATEGLSLGWAAKVGEFFATGTKITVESEIRDIGQGGQF